MDQNFNQQPNQYYQQPQQNQYYQQPQQNQYYQQDPYQNNMGFDPGMSAQQETVFGQVNTLMHEEVIAKSFLYMVAALVVTAVAAFAAPDALATVLQANPSAIFILFIAELAIVFVSNIAIKKNNAVLTAVLFTIYSFLTGATLGIIFWAYDLGSVGAVFLMTAGMFAATAIYGLVTKNDLSSIGSICLMGVIGIIIVTLVNMLFLHSEGLDLAVSYIGVFIFVALTAYDTQKIKKSVAYATPDRTATLALSGAFELYLDFINIFIRLLRIMGRRK
ncbi:MAG: Bax inhibitor-1/YccA family protein [Lachnospiraceae bacterium]|nr:Bax inhibitor-1/YccA family protein [Lachnospiraceae bacterium]